MTENERKQALVDESISFHSKLNICKDSSMAPVIPPNIIIDEKLQQLNEGPSSVLNMTTLIPLVPNRRNSRCYSNSSEESEREIRLNSC